MVKYNAYEWTEEIDQYIIKNFHKVSYAEMEKKIGYHAKSIYRRANKIVPPLHRQKRNWTEMEDELLFLHYGKKPLSEIAKVLRRTEDSITQRVYKSEGLTDAAMVSGMLKPIDVAEITGVDHKTVINWIDKGWLNAYRPDRKILIDEAYFWKWLKDNINRVNYKRVDEYILTTSPEWYSVEIKQKQRDFYTGKLNKHKEPYTSNENAIILHMKRNGASFNEITKEINRTYYSVKYQYHKLQRERKSA